MAGGNVLGDDDDSSPYLRDARKERKQVEWGPGGGSLVCGTWVKSGQGGMSSDERMRCSETLTP